MVAPVNSPEEHNAVLNLHAVHKELREQLIMMVAVVTSHPRTTLEALHEKCLEIHHRMCNEIELRKIKELGGAEPNTTIDMIKSLLVEQLQFIIKEVST
jgi:hypothetical protein